MTMSCHPSPGEVPETEGLDSLRQHISDVLEKEILGAWYPRTVDTLYGGFLSDFDAEWKPDGPQNKMIVSQARQVWTSSKAFARYPAQIRYRDIARDGFDFLKLKMWDSVYGGFFNLVTREGDPIPLDQPGDYQKQAYGNAFGIYGLSAYFAISRDSQALELAQRCFLWLEAHSHDPVYGGYFQFLNREGMPMTDGFAGTPPKDQNSSIHLLEAFTELYQVWPDPLLGKRLQEMIVIVRDTLTGDKGYLTLFCGQDWTPLSYRDSALAVRQAHYYLDEVSFGHDIETAYLLREAEETLSHGISSRTEIVTKKMADHALDHGFDMKNGGLYDAGYYEMVPGPLTIVKDTKNWWAQAETLNTLLIFAQEYPGDPHLYLQLFKQQWQYIDQYLIDHRHGGWYNYGLDKSPENQTQHKAHIWKSPYHTARAQMNVTDRLQSMQ
ncbi:MAG: AGE family epimerase/isomerase [Saprospiraceae bacterium]|nr:AGE family epimerase/isomerase [Saprospiraceae bacterium]